MFSSLRTSQRSPLLKAHPIDVDLLGMRSDQSLFAHQRVFRFVAVCWAAFIPAFVLSLVTDVVAFDAMALVTGFITVSASAIGLPIGLTSLMFDRYQPSNREQAPRKRTKFTSNGDTVATLTPAMHLRYGVGAMSLLAATPALTHATVGRVMVATASILLGVRFVFAMRVTVDNSRVRIVKLLRTVSIPADEAFIALRRPVHAGGTRDVAPLDPVVTIYDQALDPHPLPYYGSQSATSRWFVSMAGDLLGTNRQSVDAKSLALADSRHRTRSTDRYNRIRLSVFPLGFTVMGLTFGGRSLQDFEGDPVWYDDWWFLPLCFLGIVVGILWTRHLFSTYRSFEDRLVEEPTRNQQGG